MEDDNLSILDLLFCAFGGVLIIFVLLAASIGSRNQSENGPYLWIQTQANSTGQLVVVELQPLTDAPSGRLKFSEASPAGKCEPPGQDLSAVEPSCLFAGKDGYYGEAMWRYDENEAGGLFDVFVPKLGTGRYRIYLSCHACDQGGLASVYIQYPSRGAEGYKVRQLSFMNAEHVFEEDIEIDL